MWILAILAVAFIAFEANSGKPASPAVTKTTLANVAANWPTHIVLDVNKIKALGYTPNVITLYEGVDPRVLAAMSQIDPNVSQTILGSVSGWVGEQLAMGQRVWIGSPIQNETAAIPSAYLPFYVGANPPIAGGFVEITA